MFILPAYKTGWAIQYPPKAEKCGPIILLDIEKAGKKSKASCPLSVAIRMAATPFQLVVATVL